MKLIEALKLVNERLKDLSAQHLFVLACGFTPLHLKTFLGGELAQRISGGAVLVDVGLFGDLLGTLRKVRDAGDTGPSGAAVVLEWSDLDPRLGWRTTHGWRPDRHADILDSVTRRLDELAKEVLAVAEARSVAVSLPTLPLPPLFKSPTATGDAIAWNLRVRVQQFAATIAAASRCRVIDSQWLDTESPLAARHDAASDLRSGYPYQMEHAAKLAQGLAALLKPAAAKKGIITDLDNTLWHGIIGEDGVANVAWDLDHHALGHGLYQEQLAALADLGVLIAVASKNDAKIATQGLARTDLVVPTDKLFPVEANWGPKSESIRRILTAWNIHPDAVVFVDDSPTELAEVASAFPQITTKQFPTGNEAAIVQLLNELRGLFGKTQVTEEDKLRVASLKANQQLEAAEANPDEFLSQAQATITLEWNQPDTRMFELLNKTNQFNLNGRRIDETSWSTRLADPQTFVLSVSYADKYAPLGKIAAVVGKRIDSKTARIDAWVLSCRAFSRRIEHTTVKALFDRLSCDTLQFDFAATDRNGPLQETLQQLCGAAPSGSATLHKSQFAWNCPQLFSQVINHEQPSANAA